jgi:predicted phage terminase large subunit-like protein
LASASSVALRDALPLAALSLQRKRVLEDTTAWRSMARPSQLTPAGQWYVWLVMAGRGWGKTRTGAEDMAAYARANPGVRLAVVGATAASARDVCVEGESGLLNGLSRRLIETWNRSMGELVLTNGARFKLFSADEPDRLRGYQHHRAWCDEIASWRYPDAWDQLLFGLRLGDDPRVIVTTTPRPTQLIRSLLNREGVTVTRGSTFENEANLAPAALAQLRDRYEGSRIGRQELYAEVLDDVPGALWQRAQIDNLRVRTHPDLQRVVVAIDPAVTSGEESDETGIVVVGKGVDGHGYVLADRTCRLSPDGWAQRAIRAYDEFNGDRIIAEVNNGGDLVERVIRVQGGHYPYRAVRASHGKATRAEPIAALYEQGRVHHVGSFPDLEDQQCAYTPDGYDGSPDRVDALVWALSELMVTKTSRPEFV